MTEQLTYNNRPVPWITRWSSEVCSPGPKILATDTTSGLRLRFEDERPQDRIDGVLYLREGQSPGVGEPLWRDVHTHRQRQCMVESRCQVCGDRIDPPVPWILPPQGHLVQRFGESIITDAAPTCESCIDAAMHLCPHLSTHPSKIVSVRGFRVHSVFGDIIDYSGTYGRRRHYQADRRVGGDHPLDNIVVRQTIVELWSHRRRQP